MELEEQRRRHLVLGPEKRLTASTIASSSSSTRATGMPDWMTAAAVSTAPFMLANEQTAADVASGTRCRRRVISVITPSVPSEPTKRRVRS